MVGVNNNDVYDAKRIIRNIKKLLTDTPNQGHAD